MSNVQITQELYDLLVLYHLFGDTSEAQRIEMLLKKKELAIRKRIAYGKMRDPSLSEDERMEAKDWYHDLNGPNPDL